MRASSRKEPLRVAIEGGSDTGDRLSGCRGTREECSLTRQA
jgi:hypothetical protein